MNELKKLRGLLHFWKEHNDENVQSYMEWAEKISLPVVRQCQLKCILLHQVNAAADAVEVRPTPTHTQNQAG
jgi:hypothetical protein